LTNNSKGLTATAINILNITKSGETKESLLHKEEEFKKRLEAESKEREYKKWKKENDPVEIKKIRKEEDQHIFIYFYIWLPIMIFASWFLFYR
jgi:ATP-dependent Zn protease